MLMIRRADDDRVDVFACEQIVVVVIAEHTIVRLAGLLRVYQ